MNFNVYIDDNLAKKLIHFCQFSRKKRNTVIRDAIELYIHQATTSTWPKSVLEFEGAAGVSEFEDFRQVINSTQSHIFGSG